MQICKVCNNIKISQIDYSKIYYFHQFNVDIQLDVRNERKRVSKMWENAYLSIENPKVSTSSSLHTHNFASVHQQLSVSEAGAHLAKYWFYISIIMKFSKDLSSH